MSAPEKRTFAVISACMRADGKPAFARTEVTVSADEADNGVHYYLVEGELMEAGYEEPMVHFTEDEAPAFLFPAVEECLAVSTVVHNLTLSEGA